VIRLAALGKAKDIALAAQDINKWVALKAEIAALENSPTDEGERVTSERQAQLFPPPLVITCDDVSKSKKDRQEAPPPPAKNGEYAVKSPDILEAKKSHPVITPTMEFCQECHDGRIPQWVKSESTVCDTVHRIDYCLQRAPTRAFREYFSALKAHTSYFWERDVIQFIMETVRDSEGSIGIDSTVGAAHDAVTELNPRKEAAEAADDIDDCYVAPPAAKVLTKNETVPSVRPVARIANAEIPGNLLAEGLIHGLAPSSKIISNADAMQMVKATAGEVHANDEPKITKLMVGPKAEENY
jgi:hypothetical protein